jgi:hypothetical protein
LEGEAHAAAAAVLAGRRFNCTIPDSPRRVRCWSYAGHYYTPYFIMLAAGVDDPTAQLMAFYAQMPDEVTELDAFRAGVELASLKWYDISAKYDSPFSAPIDTKPARQLAHDIQRGLHCLTGRDASLEVEIRTKLLKGQKWGSLEFGLAIHAYGDSFAHQDIDHPGRMYAPGKGHGLDGHGPDSIEERSDLYVRYATGFYNVVVGMTPGIHTRPLARLGKDQAEQRARLFDHLRDIATLKGNEAQKKRIMEITRTALNMQMNPYGPKGEGPKCNAVSGKKLSAQYPHFVSEPMIKRAIATARRWSWAT